MCNIITFPGAQYQSRELRTAPVSLLPLLERIKKLDPENYEFIVKTICIYAHENPACLKKE